MSQFSRVCGSSYVEVRSWYCAWAKMARFSFGFVIDVQFGVANFCTDVCLPHGVFRLPNGSSSVLQDRLRL